MNTNDDGATAVADAQINETQTTNEQAEAPAAETKAKKKTKAAPVAATKINASMADKKAAADGIAQESDMTYSIPLTSLTANENPREEPSNLAAMGYKLIDSENPTQSLLHMCLSDDEDTLRAVVELFETHEGNDVVVADQAEPKADLSDVKAKETTLVKKSICSLALSIAAKQLQPVTVLRGGKRKDGGYNYTLVFGQRRTAAKLYAYAKSRVDKLDKVTDSQFKNVLPVITAVELNCSLEQAFEYAVAENMNRKDFTPIQEGRIYAAYMKRVNPTTGKKYNLKDITRHLYPQEGTAKYGHVRNRYALVMPYKADKVDDKGNITERGRGLTDEQRAEVEAGTKTLTWAIRTALREEHYNPEGFFVVT